MTLRNDATRPEARLSGGRRTRTMIPGQGHVLLDIDLTAGADAELERVEVEALDTLGPAAAPLAAAGFAIGAGGTISAGRLYLDGLLVDNPIATTMADQPHPCDPLPPTPSIVGLKALVRFIDPVEDRRLTDKALGDAVSSGRGMVDWQVFPVALPPGGEPDCGVASADWDKLTAPSSGRLSARVDPGVAATNFCTPSANGGYSRLENLLYRIEVDGGVAVPGYPTIDGARYGLDGLRLKLSRRNASLMARIVGYAGRELQLDPPALDGGLWFKPGGVTEIVSIHDDVDQRPAAGQTRLFTVARALDDRVSLAAGAAIPLPPAAGLGSDWYLRMWDTFPDFALSATATVGGGGGVSAEIDCGDGVLVTLAAAQAGDTLFRRGDYWSFTARVDGTIDWPESAPNVPAQSPPHGPAIHYTRLAVAPGAKGAPVDCRPLFLPLTLQRTLLHRGGDGQTACLTDDPGAFVPLRAKLRVAAVCGGLPCAGVEIRWSTPAGAPASLVDGLVLPTVTTTGADGLAEVVWSLDRTRPDDAHGVQAELASPPGSPVTPLLFDAGFETAQRTSYTPGCKLLAETTTVQGALSALCVNLERRIYESLRLTRISLRSATGAAGVQLMRDGSVLYGEDLRPDDLVGGVEFEVDRGDLVYRSRPDDPIVDLELELPYPVTTPDVEFWSRLIDAAPMSFGTQRLRLEGELTVDGALVRFLPGKSAATFLTTAARHNFGYPRPQPGRANYRVRGRLRLRSQLLWVETGTGRAYLDAGFTGAAGPTTERDLRLELQAPQRARDLDMWFYLTPPPPPPPIKTGTITDVATEAVKEAPGATEVPTRTARGSS